MMHEHGLVAWVEILMTHVLYGIHVDTTLVGVRSYMYSATPGVSVVRGGVKTQRTRNGPGEGRRGESEERRERQARTRTLDS